MTNLEKIQSNKVIKMFSEILERTIWARLTGGAIIDILEGRTPKDYDFIDYSQEDIDAFKKAGFMFQCETKYAITYQKDGFIVQFLKTSFSDFDFIISQSCYDFSSKKLIIDETSFEHKTLIPVNFEDKESALSCLVRLPHWRKKGYEIHDATYLSLLETIAGKSLKNNLHS